MFAVPAYGSQPPEWWVRYNALAMSAHKYGLDFRGSIVEGTAVVDYNRNLIGKKALEMDEVPDWLFWMDHDTLPPLAGLGRLFEVRHPLVSGLYYGKKHPYRPIAYYRRKDGLYQNVTDFYAGQILDVDATGIGCLLMHTSVLKLYQDNFVPLQRDSGGIFPVHKDMIKGKIPEDRRNKSDGTVRNGVYQERVFHPKKVNAFPFFYSQYGRTEDIPFFENLAMLGLKPKLDTGVVCTHIGRKEFGRDDFEKQVWYEKWGKDTPPELLHESA